MKKLTLLLKGIPYRSGRDLAKVRVRMVVADSKAVRPKDLFVAIRGARHDGHLFVKEAVQRGAAAVVVDRLVLLPGYKGVLIHVDDTPRRISRIASNYFGHPSDALTTIGITGTNGKTTITYLIEGIVKASGHSAGVIGTINYRIGRTVRESTNTTPGALELQRLLAEIKRAGARYAVMEVSSHALEQGRVAEVGFDAAIVTNITREHLDYHRTVGRYAAAKAKILTYLKPGGVAILNADDPLVRSLAARTRRRVLTYGITGRAKVRALDIKMTRDGMTFTVKTPQKSFTIKTPLLGRHNVSNILAAAACALDAGMTVIAIQKGISTVRRVPGRLEAVRARAPYRVYVDYAHTDDALHNVLTLLREIAPRRVITLFGCGGDRDTTKRPRMGRVACALSDTVILTSDNPRSERPSAIISDIVKGVRGRYSNYTVCEDRRTAICRAIGAAGEGDIVLIAGKGHEQYQVVGKRTYPFDDCRIAGDAMKRRGVG